MRASSLRMRRRHVVEEHRSVDRADGLAPLEPRLPAVEAPERRRDRHPAVDLPGIRVLGQLARARRVLRAAAALRLVAGDPRMLAARPALEPARVLAPVEVA